MREAFDGFYRGRRVLVTGHTGFKGSWLSLWLESLGARVSGFALAPPTNPSHFDALGLAGRMDDRRGDVRDAALLAKIVAEVKPEVVFHLAAQPLVRLSYEQPVETMASNVMGTAHLLEAVRGLRSPCVCQIITTDKCYENREWIYAYRENDALGGYDPYSASKAGAELMTASWRQSFFHPDRLAEHGVSVASVRAGNVIGGGDWALDRIVPDCVRALMAGKTIPVRNPEAIRPWQHVLEPLSGYLWLAARQATRAPEFADSFNFGPQAGDALPVREVARLVVESWGEGRWEATGVGGPHEARFLKLDTAKAQALLGWRPVYGAAQAIAHTVAWYRASAAGKMDASPFGLRQIHDFVEQARAMKLAWAG
ncbi:MAG: CDP-glucose 4,6-dehydratase [Spirochaetes bacterium]|nr:CDP-glucose 4,6-dehydratase [Spirochaetota bacterium]